MLSPDHCLTHFPKDPLCEICNRCKKQKKECRKVQDRTTFAGWVEPTKSAVLLTADHAIVAELSLIHI